MNVSYFYIHKDASGQWRWKFVGKNSKTIAVSSESYRNLADCEHSTSLVKSEASTSPTIGDDDYKKLRP